MQTSRPIIALATSALVALSLISCTPVAPAAGPTRPPAPVSSSPTADPTPGPTTNPDTPDDETELVGAPQPRISLGCDEFTTAAERAAVTGVPAAELQLDQQIEMNSGVAATMQAGSISCRWWGPVVDVEMSASIDIEIVPDAAEEYAGVLDYYESFGVADGLGPNSLIHCNKFDVSFSCKLLFLVDGYWTEIEIAGAAKKNTTVAKLKPVALKFGNAVRASLESAGPLGAAFVAPAGSLKTWESCAEIDNSKGFRKAIASPSMIKPEGDSFDGGGANFVTTFRRAGLDSCVWRQKDVYTTPQGQARQVGVYILPGAGWAWPEFVRSALTASSDGETVGEKITVEGADDAVIRCWTADECTIEALVQGSYLSVNSSYEGGKKAKAAAVTALEYIIARLI